MCVCGGGGCVFVRGYVLVCVCVCVCVPVCMCVRAPYTVCLCCQRQKGSLDCLWQMFLMMLSERHIR